jgi:sugar phosphate isomerase/epimerase
MNIRYSTASLIYGQEEAYLDPEKIFERSKRYGYDGVEIVPPAGRYGMGVGIREYGKIIMELSAKFDLPVCAVNECWGNKWDPRNPLKDITRPETAPAVIHWTKEMIDFAGAVGCPLVNVTITPHEGVEDASRAVEVTVKSIKEIAEYAGAKGVTIILESINHIEAGKFANTVGNHKKIIGLVDLPNVAIQMDIFHSNFEEVSISDAIREAGPLLRHFHFRDSNSLPPGYGTVDWKAVLRALKDIDYDGYCTLEGTPLIPDADTATKDQIEYLKMIEKFVDFQRSNLFPNGFALI